MITYLKNREVYEDRYDRITVEIGRREGASLGWVFSESLEKMENKGLANFWEERIYWWLIEIPYLLPRWEERDVTIESWMFEDRMFDKRLEEARPLRRSFLIRRRTLATRLFINFCAKTT